MNISLTITSESYKILPYSHTNDTNDKECAICINGDNDFISKTWVKLGCSHFFHRHCIDTWLEKSETCPICVQNVYIINDINNNQESKDIRILLKDPFLTSINTIQSILKDPISVSNISNISNETNGNSCNSKSVIICLLSLIIFSLSIIIFSYKT